MARSRGLLFFSRALHLIVGRIGLSTRTMKMHARRWTSGLKVSTATMDWEWNDLGPSDGVWVSFRKSCWRNLGISRCFYSQFLCFVFQDWWWASLD